MAESNLEQRVSAVEQAVRDLQLATQERKPAHHWLARLIGSMRDEPDFDEVVAHGAAIRQTDRRAEESSS